MDKFVAYRNFMNRREGKPVLSGPVEPCPHFSPAVDLAPCRDLCELEPARCDGLGSRKRKRSEDGDGEADKDRTNESADSGVARLTACMFFIYSLVRLYVFSHMCAELRTAMFLPCFSSKTVSQAHVCRLFLPA